MEWNYWYEFIPKTTPTMYFLIVLTTDYSWRSWTSRIAAPYKSGVDWLIDWLIDRSCEWLLCRLHGPAGGAGWRSIPTNKHGSNWPNVSQHSAAALLHSDWWNLQTDVEHQGRGEGVAVIDVNVNNWMNALQVISETSLLSQLLELVPILCW